METLAPVDTLTSQMTWDPFCAQEGVQTLQSSEHFYRLARITHDVRLHLEEQGLPYTLASDLLIRHIPLKPGVAPDVALWPDHLDLEGTRTQCGSLELSAELYPALILEVVSAHTAEADADIKYEIYRRAGITEYWLYDPDAHAGGEPLCGWRLVDTAYIPIRGRMGTEAVVRYPSAVLQTDWGLTTDAELRLWDSQQADWYRTTPAALRQLRAWTQQAKIRLRQEQDRAEQVEIRLRQERTRAEQAEAENARLRALLQAQADRDGTSEAEC